MKDAQLDIIMKKQMENKNSSIDVESSVMNRIKAYEENKSLRLLYFEYILSALVLCSGIASIFVIQYAFNSYSSFLELYWNYIQIAAWVITGIFVFIAFSSFWIIYFARILKTEKKLIKSTL